MKRTSVSGVNRGPQPGRTEGCSSPASVGAASGRCPLPVVEDPVSNGQSVMVQHLSTSGLVCSSGVPSSHSSDLRCSSFSQRCTALADVCNVLGRLATSTGSAPTFGSLHADRTVASHRCSAALSALSLAAMPEDSLRALEVRRMLWQAKGRGQHAWAVLCACRWGERQPPAALQASQPYPPQHTVTHALQQADWSTAAVPQDRAFGRCMTEQMSPSRAGEHVPHEELGAARPS